MEIQDIKRRNDLLAKYFKSKSLDFKIIGDMNTPAVVDLSMNVCLSCYVHNFYLIFTDKPYDGEELFRVKLSPTIDTSMDNEFRVWYRDFEHRTIYRIIAKLNTSGLGYLFLTGFHKREDGNLNPVFCEVNAKIYFTKEKAEEIALKFSTENIQLVVI